MPKNTAAADEFDPTSVEIEEKGRMVLLYATVNGVREHVASFFHKNKAEWIVEAIEGHHEVPLKKKSAPKKTAAPAKKAVAKKPIKKKVKR